MNEDDSQSNGGRSASQKSIKGDFVGETGPEMVNMKFDGKKGSASSGDSAMKKLNKTAAKGQSSTEHQDINNDGDATKRGSGLSKQRTL